MIKTKPAISISRHEGNKIKEYFSLIAIKDSS
jgi:hypothetical protein